MILVISPITLAECLVLPFRSNRGDLVERFDEQLTENEKFIATLDIDKHIARIAAWMRAKDRLSLPDALQLASASEASCDSILD